jgi:hypothetical protein
MSGENSFGHRITLQTKNPRSCTAHPVAKLAMNHRILHCEGYLAEMKYAPISEAAEKARHGGAMMFALWNANYRDRGVD